MQKYSQNEFIENNFEIQFQSYVFEAYNEYTYHANFLIIMDIHKCLFEYQD